MNEHQIKEIDKRLYKLLERIEELEKKLNNLESVLKEERIKSLAFFNSIYPKGKPDYEKYVELCIEYFKRDDLFTKKSAGGNRSNVLDGIVPKGKGVGSIPQSTTDALGYQKGIKNFGVAYGIEDAPAEDITIEEVVTTANKTFKTIEKELIAEFIQKLRNLPEGMSDEYYYMIEKETLTKLIEEYEKRLEKQDKK